MVRIIKGGSDALRKSAALTSELRPGPQTDRFVGLEPFLLLAVLRLEGNADGGAIHRELLEYAGRPNLLSNVHGALQRLRERKLVILESGPAARSGRTKHLFRLSPLGKAMVSGFYSALVHLAGEPGLAPENAQLIPKAEKAHGFKYLVLMGVRKLDGQGPSQALQDELQRFFEKQLSYGDVNGTLNRLAEDGFVAMTRSNPRPVRGGRFCWLPSLTSEGAKALDDYFNAFCKMADGVLTKRISQ
jgi:hypothetical protein